MIAVGEFKLQASDGTWHRCWCTAPFGSGGGDVAGAFYLLASGRRFLWCWDGLIVEQLRFRVEPDLVLGVLDRMAEVNPFAGGSPGDAGVEYWRPQPEPAEQLILEEAA